LTYNGKENGKVVKSHRRKGETRMKLFLDTANVSYIREINDLGVICGVTTNPSLIAKEGRDFKEVVTEITSIVDGPISAEVIDMKAEGMVAEAKELVKIHKNIVIKIPMCAEGLKAAAALTKMGIKTNVTLIFSAAQALLAAREDVTACAMAGAHIATVPYETMKKCIDHPLTTQGIERFLKDWETVPKK